MDSRTFIFAVGVIITYHSISLKNGQGFAAGNPVDTDSDDIKPPAKLCMGANTKPTRDRSIADEECTADFSNKRCSRLCRLEKLGVIGNNNDINNYMWPSFVEASFPTIAHPHLIPLFKACTPKFARGTNSKTSEDCVENTDFSNCMRDAVQDVCSRPLPL